jgi:hypothetical protein
LNRLPPVRDAIVRAYQFIDRTQIADDVPDRVKFYRHISKGGWPFSTQDHGTDATSRRCLRTPSRCRVVERFASCE